MHKLAKFNIIYIVYVRYYYSSKFQIIQFTVRETT